MIANAAWLCEFILEALGFYCFYRRRITAFWGWLGFRALADLICFLLPARFYALADYSQRHIQYLFFAAVCTYAAWRILREVKSAGTYIAGVCILMVMAILRAHSFWPLSAQRVLSLETWAEMVLAAFVAFALGTANGREPKPWGVISIALIVLGGSDGLITLARQAGYHAESLYPAGALVALIMLCWAGMRGWPAEAPRSVPPKFQPASVKMPERPVEWVM